MNHRVKADAVLADKAYDADERMGQKLKEKDRDPTQKEPVDSRMLG